MLRASAQLRASATQVPTVSVLMSTYACERAAWLAEALETIFAQTRAPDQMVLVVDGPVAADQEEVIARYARDTRITTMDVVRLPVNGGLAKALNAGLVRCTGNWTMRMDSDDVCIHDRLRVQLDYAEAHPETNVITSWSEEFFEGSGDRTRLKCSPVRHDTVVQALCWRNVLVHPSLLIRTDLLRSVGGYRADFGKLEDYDLFVRLSLAGARFHVLPTVLVRMRSGLEQSARRGGWDYCVNEVRFRTFCWRKGFLNFRQYLVITFAYTAFRLIGPILRGNLYPVTRA